MVLESIIRPSKMEKTPEEMLWVGFFYSSIGLFLASIVLGSYASISAVFITTIPLIVIMYKTIKYEESKDHRIHEERFLIREHGKALSMFMFLFIGMVISYTLWFVILPENMTATLFEFQLDMIQSVNQGAMGNFGNPSSAFSEILLNNFKVLGFCIIFSFLYGAGAIFILTVNASVVGVFVGSIIRRSISLYGDLKGSALQGYLGAFPLSFAIMIHGIPEIAAFFLGALGGGIISVAVVNHSIRSREFRHILIDSLDLILLSAVLLITAAIIEVFVSPLLV